MVGKCLFTDCYCELSYMYLSTHNIGPHHNNVLINKDILTGLKFKVKDAVMPDCISLSAGKTVKESLAATYTRRKK